MSERSHLLCAASALALLISAPAWAQTPPDDPDTQTDEQAADETDADAEAQSGADAIVVYGYRRALQDALAEKRAAPNVVEVLATDDIGKLPELSIAESLARLPGLTTNRDRGNGTEVSIRGMGPNLVNTLLNGREVATAEASRNVRYEQYPAELINGAYVFKSPTASQVEGAIAGQIDLHTVRPLDVGESRVVLDVRGVYNDLAGDIEDASDTGQFISASYIGQFWNNTLGVALGYAERNQPVATARTNVFRYTNSFGDLDGDGAGNDEIPYGYEALVRGGDDKRQGLVGALQYKPNSHFELNGDIFYSNVEFTETQRGFRLEDLPFGNDFSDATVTDGGVIGLTSVKNADFGLKARNVNEFFQFEDELWAGGVNAEWSDGPWLVAADVGYSTVSRDQVFMTVRTEAHDVSGPTPVQLLSGPGSSFYSQPDEPTQFGFNFDISDPATNLISEFQIPENGGGAPLINDDLLTGSLDFELALDDPLFTAWKAGVRYTDRNKDYTQRTQFGFVDVANRTPIPDGLLNDPVSFPNEFSDIPQTISFDIPAVIEQYFGPIDPQTSVFDQRSSWDVNEKTASFYAQADMETELFSLPLTGNIGFRVVNTDITSRSSRVQQSDGSDAFAVPVEFKNQFTDFLPNANVTLELSDSQQVRLGVSKAISRPPLDDLNAGFGVFIFGAPEAFGGNPDLEPFRADQYDVTYEHYFNDDTALTIAGFYKDIDTYIVDQVTAIQVPDDNGMMLDGTFRQPVNGEGGNIKGFEVLYEQAFTFLPKPFDGFGIYANYAYTDSSISVAEDDNFITNIALPGLSKHVGNVTAYYYKKGFEARIGVRYRDKFAAELGDTDRIVINDSETVADFQTSYAFQDGSALEGLQLIFSVNNLTDEPFQTYYGDRARQGRYETFGRRFFFGATYTFGL